MIKFHHNNPSISSNSIKVCSFASILATRHTNDSRNTVGIKYRDWITDLGSIFTQFGLNEIVDMSDHSHKVQTISSFALEFNLLPALLL